MKRTITIIILLIGLVVAAAFAFFQTRSLASLQESSTEIVSILEGSSTQAVSFGIATETALADSAYATYTQAAQDLGDIAATSSQAAIVSHEDLQNAAATSTQAANEAIGTGTQSAYAAMATGTSFAYYGFATGTALADSAFSTSTEAAAMLSTEAALGTDSAMMIHTQNAELSSVSTQQSNLETQNLALSGTVEASGWVGEGLFGESANLPEGFERFEGGGFEIALPESFEGADLNDNPRSFFALLDSLGLDGSSDYLRAQDENFLFFAIDNELVNDVPRVTVSLLRDTPAIESNLSEYLGGAYVGNSALVISDVLPVNGQAAGRSIVEQTFENGAVRQMQYVFQLEASFYVLTFTTPMSEFAAMRPVLEEIAASLRIRN